MKYKLCIRKNSQLRIMIILHFKNRLSLLRNIFKYKIIKLIKFQKSKKFCKANKSLMQIFKSMNRTINKKKAFHTQKPFKNKLLKSSPHKYKNKKNNHHTMKINPHYNTLINNQMKILIYKTASQNNHNNISNLKKAVFRIHISNIFTIMPCSRSTNMYHNLRIWSRHCFL